MFGVEVPSNIWEAISAIVSLGILWLTYVTIKHIQREAKDRDFFARADARAYVNVSFEYGQARATGDYHITGRLDVFNYGRTPAKDIEVHGKFIRHVGLTKIASDGYKIPWNRNAFSLMRGGGYQTTIADTIHPDIMIDIMNPDRTLTLCFLGRVRYKDVFGTSWVHRFAWEIIWDEKGDRYLRKNVDWNKERVEVEADLM